MSARPSARRRVTVLAGTLAAWPCPARSAPARPPRTARCRTR
ncbi:hypothetical protein ACFQ1I_17490 [Kitasatospora arboriphila]